MKRIRTLIVFMAPALALLVGGCGGNGSQAATTVTPKLGRLAVNIEWPNTPASRVIPTASNSISLTVQDSHGTSVAQTLLVKPASSWTSGVLSPGTYTLSATAYPNNAGAGNAQATGTSTVTIVENHDTPATLTMASTVATVNISTMQTLINVGAADQFIASCKDAQGKTVLVAPGALTWNSTNTTAATIDGNGLVTALAGGYPNISATFTEVASNIGQQPVVSSSIPLEIIKPSGYVPNGYSLAWSDEFNGALGSTPNPANWTYDLGGGGWGNNEQEIYTNTNASVVSDPQATDGLALDIKATTDGTNYYSSRIKTEGLKNFRYGYIECRAKVPPGGPSYQGYWPAFWMLGSSITSVGWPTCGEQDVMEHLNGTQPKVAYQSLHANTSSSSAWDITNTYTGTGDLGSGYHVYAVLWNVDSVTFYVDGVQDGPTQTPSNIGTGNVWEFNQQEFLILNMAVGGGFPGNATSSTVFPADYMIDYVRVYQLK